MKLNVSENVNGHVYILQDIKCLVTPREFKDLSSIVHKHKTPSYNPRPLVSENYCFSFISIGAFWWKNY